MTRNNLGQKATETYSGALVRLQEYHWGHKKASLGGLLVLVGLLADSLLASLPEGGCIKLLEI